MFPVPSKANDPVRSVRTKTESTVELPDEPSGQVAVQEIEAVASDEAVAGTRPRPAETASSEPAGRSWRTDIKYNRLFAISDTAAIVLALGFSAIILSLVGRTPDTGRTIVTASLMLPVWFVIAYIAGLYSLVDLRISHSLADEIGRVTIAATAWSWLLLVARTPLTAGPIPMAGPILRWVMVIVLILVLRSLIREVARKWAWNRQPVALIGNSAGLELLTERVDRHPEWGLEIRANFSFPRPGGEPGKLAEAIRSSGVERVVIVGASEGHASRNRLVNELIERDLMVDLVSGGPETLYPNAALHDLEGLPVLSVKPSRLRPIDLRIKRGMDILLSGIGLILTAPVIAWAAIRIKLDSPGPVFFRQVRCGFHGEEFEMLKLRTMVDGADGMRQELREAAADQGDDDVLLKLTDDPRVTRVGRTLRRWSIDELPQLWNVLTGDMSLVGPRPLPLDEACQVTGLFDARTRFRPGIAGPWQALGRSTIPFDDMIRLDYTYVTAWSIAEDIRLLIRTALAALSRRGAR